MESFIKNKNALIWAFNENIDRDTKFEGNTLKNSIDETKIIINYLRSERCFDSNITETIIEEYSSILENIIHIIPLQSSKEKSNEYLLSGWKGHGILLFWEKQTNEMYNFGIINCGEGIEIQGYNEILCNGLNIFKNITKERIDSFLQTYKNYFNNTINDSNFNKNQIYNIFYFILFDKLLNIKETVNFQTLDKSLVDFYKLESQIIGSCAFTNLINLIYYIYLKKQTGKTNSNFDTDYLEW